MPGDVLLLYTDGLVEAKVGGRYVGTEGLTRLFAEAVTQERTMQGAVERLVRHVGIEAPHDDVTVVMLRRNSPTERG
jgi:serine phosphatase RsbU (regulator of sigma subunit)